MYPLAGCHGLPRLCRDASRLPRVVQATEHTCAVLWPLCRTETVGEMLSSCSKFQRPGSDRSTNSPGVRTRARPSKQRCPLDINGATVEAGQKRKMNKRKRRLAEGSTLGERARVEAGPGTFGNGLDGCRRENQWHGEVTLLALVSQRCRLHSPRPAMVSFVIIARSPTFMHPFLPNTIPLIHAMHAWEREGEGTYLYETLALI